MDLLKTKPLEMLREESEEAGEHTLKRALTRLPSSSNRMPSR